MENLYRSRSSSMILVLSPAGGMRFHISCIASKRSAFFLADKRGTALRGRNSATGWPRRSITIISPAAVARTNSEVWMCNSRIETCRIAAL